MKHHPEITDSMIEIFMLVVLESDHNKRRATELIRKLPPQARRDLRAALQELDELLDDVTLAEMRERRPWKL
jgi:hypothetical protein